MHREIYFHTCGKPLLVTQPDTGGFAFFKLVGKNQLGERINHCHGCGGALLPTDVGTLLKPAAEILSLNKDENND